MLRQFLLFLSSLYSYDELSDSGGDMFSAVLWNKVKNNQHPSWYRESRVCLKWMGAILQKLCGVGGTRTDDKGKKGWGAGAWVLSENQCEQSFPLLMVDTHSCPGDHKSRRYVMKEVWVDFLEHKSVVLVYFTGVVRELHLILCFFSTGIMPEESETRRKSEDFLIYSYGAEANPSFGTPEKCTIEMCHDLKNYCSSTHGR